LARRRSRTLLNLYLRHGRNVLVCSWLAEEETSDA
jgi:hypothetical protein